MYSVPYPIGRGRLLRDKFIEQSIERDADGIVFNAQFADHGSHPAGKTLTHVIGRTFSEGALPRDEWCTKDQPDGRILVPDLLKQTAVRGLPGIEVKLFSTTFVQPSVDVVGTDKHRSSTSSCHRAARSQSLCPLKPRLKKLYPDLGRELWISEAISIT